MINREYLEDLYAVLRAADKARCTEYVKQLSDYIRGLEVNHEGADFSQYEEYRKMMGSNIADPRLGDVCLEEYQRACTN